MYTTNCYSIIQNNHRPRFPFLPTLPTNSYTDVHGKYIISSISRYLQESRVSIFRNKGHELTSRLEFLFLDMTITTTKQQSQIYSASLIRGCQRYFSSDNKVQGKGRRWRPFQPKLLRLSGNSILVVVACTISRQLYMPAMHSCCCCCCCCIARQSLD